MHGYACGDRECTSAFISVMSVLVLLCIQGCAAVQASIPVYSSFACKCIKCAFGSASVDIFLHFFSPFDEIIL